MIGCALPQRNALTRSPLSVATRPSPTASSRFGPTSSPTSCGHSAYARGFRRRLCSNVRSSMVVALLGILKAGGAYVPLDPVNPADRLAFMLQDARVECCSPRELWPGCVDAHGATCSPRSRLAGRWRREPATPLARRRRPAAPGLRHLHLGLDRQAQGRDVDARQRGAAVRRHRSTGSGSATTDVWTLFHSYAFDFSVWEIWGALLYGGRLVVVPYLTSAARPKRSCELLPASSVTVLNQTPSAFRQLIARRPLSARRRARWRCAT